MDVKKLGTILTVGGAAVILAALVWWYSFFSSVVNAVTNVSGGKGSLRIMDAKSCIYSNDDFCMLIAGGARMLGETPYEPKVFWIGLAALVAGALIWATAKPSGAK